MRKIMKALFYYLILTSSMLAKDYALLPIDNEILSHSFNENYDLAIKLSEKQIKLNPSIPKYYYYNINAKVLQYYERVISLEHDKRDEGRKLINAELISYFETVAEKFEDSELNVEQKFYYGAILGSLARLQGIDGSWWGAFRTGMNARSLMEEIVEKDPTFYDAFLLLGMFEYYADRMSGFVGFIASALGFSGSREKGLEYLNLAYEKGTLVFGQTALTLIEVYNNLEDNEEMALPYFKKFVSSYPNNKRITNSYCQELMNTWNFETVDSIIRNDKNNIIEEYVKARYYNSMGNSELAVAYATKALDDEKRMWRGVNDYARYIIVYNNWLMNNSSQVKKTTTLLTDRYKNVFELQEQNSGASRWLHELSVQIAKQAPIKDIEKYLSTKPEFNDTTDFESQYNLMIASYFMKNRLLEKAERNLEAAIGNTEGRNKYSAYKSFVELYMIKNTTRAKVEKLISLIDDFDNDRLKFRARDLKKKYNI